jgi:hypothetical protein
MRNFIVTFSIEAKSKVGFGSIDIESPVFPNRKIVKERLSLESDIAPGCFTIISIMELSDEDFQNFTK